MRIPDWLLRQTVTLEPYRGESAYGPVYGDPVELRCRIEARRRLVRDRQGREVVADAQAWFAPEAEVTITPESRLTWAGRTYTVLEARPMPGPNGRTHHVEVMLG